MYNNDYVFSSDFINDMYRDLMQSIKVQYAQRLNLCPVCNVYGSQQHCCSTSEVKALG